MKYDKLTQLFGNYGYFDLASLVQISEEPRENIRMQLYRWSKAGKLVPLRRGMYAFPKNFIRTSINPAELANNLYKPSYLSLQWSLGYFGLIPEKVVTYTSITSRLPKSFTNSFGNFKYQHIKMSAFFGYKPFQLAEHKVLIAEPEKALLDFWYQQTGTWDKNRMAEMRFQNFEMINHEKLLAYAVKFASPRLTAAVKEWLKLTKALDSGTIEL